MSAHTKYRGTELLRLIIGAGYYECTPEAFDQTMEEHRAHTTTRVREAVSEFVYGGTDHADQYEGMNRTQLLMILSDGRGINWF